MKFWVEILIIVIVMAVIGAVLPAVNVGIRCFG